MDSFVRALRSDDHVFYMNFCNNDIGRNGANYSCAI